jgi:Polysaccharide lyase
MTMTVLDTDTGPTANPRAQLESPPILAEGADIWVGWSTYFPSTWPVMPSGGWCVVASIFGAPFVGTGPNGWVIEGGSQSLAFAGDGTAGVRAMLLPVQRGTWMDFCVHHVMSADGTYGLTEVFTCTSATTWVQQKHAGVYGLHHATLAAGVNDGAPNSARINLYRMVGMFTTLTITHAAHKVATTCQSAIPASYPSAIKPWEL